MTRKESRNDKILHSINNLIYICMIFKTKIDVVHINSTQFSDKMFHEAMNEALESILSEVTSTPKICPHFS